MKKNDLITMNITGVTHEGDGVGHTEEGMAVFVPATAVGDKVEVRILKVNKSYAYGKAEKIIENSPDRVNSECPVFLKCGGCSYWHINYEAELRIKWQRVADALSKIGGFDILPEEIVGAGSVYGYRNKAQYPIGIGKDGLPQIGFYAPHSHNIINSSGCSIQPEIFTKITEIIRQWIIDYKIPVYNEEKHTGIIRHLYLRIGKGTGEVMICIISTQKSVPSLDKLTDVLRTNIPQIVSVMLNVNSKPTNVILGEKTLLIWGKDSIRDKLGDYYFDISPLSFYQVNPEQTVKLYGLAVDAANLTGAETVIDFYCGIGTISLFMAKKAKKVYGAEVIPEAIENAKANAKLNNMENVEFFCADAAEAAEKFKNEKVKADVIVVDPPRKGCDKSLLDTIISMAPQRVVYVSCDPATLARDLRILCDSGYDLVKATPVDMFPRTFHSECICLLEHSVQEKI